MAFSQGTAQIVHVTTYIGSTPTAPTNPVVTVSLDNGATFEATDNAATTTLYGISLVLSAAETSRPMVLVKVASDNCTLAVQAFWFEDNYTAARAPKLDNLDVALSDVQGTGGKDLDDVIAAIPGGTGAAHVHLLVKTDETPAVPVAGASVTVPGAGTQATDALGSTGWNLDDGIYTVTVRSSSFYNVQPNYTVVVEAGAVTEPAGGVLTVTPHVIADPASPEACRCYLYMYHSNGITPLGAGQGTLRVVEVRQRPAGATVVYDDDNNADTPAQTDGTGFVYLDLPRGMVCYVAASWPDRGERVREVTVPSTTTYDMSGLFQDAVPAT